ncbi:phosphoethanolamine transferase [Hoylesella timonensis]|uniref:Arylsulfatase n=1 Tax=Hoylesella timonensis TaxID=386414 RepID=A0A2N6Q7W7_9BACT|nr:phosphoethanolamine transferase [Hoylesella timonensis]PMC11101.1 arylsulfatase [Hoylesella timonensis]
MQAENQFMYPQDISRSKKIWNRIVTFIQQHFRFIMLMLFINIPYLFNISSFGRGVHHFLYMCFAIVCLTLIISLIPYKRVMRITKSIIELLSVLLLFLFLHFLYYYRSLPDSAIFEILLATNHNEVIEYLQANVLNSRLYGSICAVIFVLSAYSLLILKLQYKRSAILFASAWLTFASFFTVVNLVKDIIKQKTTTRDRLLHQCCSVVSTIFLTRDAINDMQQLKQMRQKGNTRPKLLKNNSTIPYVVFILGESTTRNHMWIYGYHLQTTPYLSSLEKTGDLVKFTDVISPNGHTIKVLEKLFTFYRQGAKGKWYEYTDLFSILNQAGYYTTWLSNQESSGIYGNNGRFYAERCKSNSFVCIRDTKSDFTEPYDEHLLPLLDQTLKQTKPKRFIVLHLIGTHMAYENRYPKTFKAFSTNVEQGENNKIKETKAAYDTAVRYNDSIVNAIINRFKDKNALIIYTSDHGEDVMEINKKIAGHGDIDINNHKVEIPMLVYMSKTFQKNYPYITNRIRLSAHHPFMTDDMIHSILDLMEIQTKEYRPSLSIFNKQFNYKRKRICAGKPYPIK